MIKRKQNTKTVNDQIETLYKPFSEGDYYVVILSGGNPTI